MKNKITLRIISVITFFSLLVTFGLNAQSDNKLLTAKGQVLTEDSLPVSNIIIKTFKSKKVSITDTEGKFSIKINRGSENLIIEKEGYKTAIVPVQAFVVEKNILTVSPVILKEKRLFDDFNETKLPFRILKTNSIVASLFSVSGEDLKSYPSASFLDALSGLIPGVYVTPVTSIPGGESQNITIRGENATVYIDGVIRDPSELVAEEVESVEVIRDLSGRAMLGIYGSGPVLWITTKTGESYLRKIKFSAEYGANMATAIPDYTNSYDYATLYNEALRNDGFDPYYSEEALNAYRNGADPVNYPNIDYFDRYLRPSSPYRRANLSFSGGDEFVNYFSMLDYTGSEGLESTRGEVYKNDRFKVRANVNIKLNDHIKMNVNLSGTYQTGRNPLTNVFSMVSSLPSNAHPIWFNEQLIVNDDYPVNIENAMVYGGYNESSSLRTQNNISVLFDLGEITEGLSAKLDVAFDASGLLNGYESESEALYRIITLPSGKDSTDLVLEKQISTGQNQGNANISRKTDISGVISYTKTVSDKHNINAFLSYYQGVFSEASYPGYQPDKMQDLSLSVNYSFDNRYILQLDQTYSGSMRMPKGEKFSLYPTIGLGWNIHNEPFFNSNNVNFLKLTASYGKIGINRFGILGFNSYYLDRTTWEPGGSWVSGIQGRTTFNNAYVIAQQGSNNFSLPKRNYLNIGLQSSVFNKHLDIEANHFRIRDYDLISQKMSFRPLIVGGDRFLSATNFGENLHYGFDGLIQYTVSSGQFNFSTGVNILYKRSRYVIVDEPLNLEEYRKNAGSDMDEFVLLQADGLFQNEQDIINHLSVTNQAYSDLVPGDIKYTDFNSDGAIDEKDYIRTGDHSPRLFYGANFSVAYKGFKIKAVGQGVADGKVSILNDIFSPTGTDKNYTSVILNRWPISNEFPRMTTSSINNNRSSTFWLRDATYFRLKNIELSYTFSPNATHKMGLTNLSLFVRGSNIAEFSSVSKYGVDPENFLAGYSVYPIYQTYTGGLSLSF